MTTPERLHLRGFSGICDGLQRDEITLDLRPGRGARLVALRGPNGRGKSTGCYI